jgi:metal-responsive CopG/Arc/MetJ family transcriptional regulator
MQGVVMMGRRRVKEKHIPMSLSMPYALIIEVDKQLSFKSSRSKWVQAAIKAKLESGERGMDDLEHVPLKTLFAELTMRLDRESNAYKFVRAALQSVETEE